MEQEHSSNISQLNSINGNLLHPNQTKQQGTIKQQNFNPRFQSSIETTSKPTSSQLNQPYSNNPASFPQKPYVPYQGVIPIKVRNRRFKKLLQLRSNGFFDQQAIKLRHPLLYYLFVGQYEFELIDESDNQESNPNSVNLLSSFLSEHLINIQYKHLLSQQMSSEVEKILQIEKNTSEQQIKQIKCLFSTKRHKNRPINNQNHENKQILIESTKMEIENPKKYFLREQSQKLKEGYPSQEHIRIILKKPENLVGPSQQNTDNGCLSDPQLVTSMYQKMVGEQKLTGEDKYIQEQHLIEYCEELFLEGKVLHLQEINYEQIDHNVQYDDWKQENKDLEEKYFDQIQIQMDPNSENYYTGVQDY